MQLWRPHLPRGGTPGALVNDILTLSNLDEAERASEGEAVPIGSTEPIELSRAILTVEQRLEQVARQSNVTIGHETKPVVIEGVSRLIDELIYNLASNAIRYNRSGGTVMLRCGTHDDGRPYLSVADTGIGIAPEEPRVKCSNVFTAWTRVVLRRVAEPAWAWRSSSTPLCTITPRLTCRVNRAWGPPLR